jgi:hypothetical protein
MAARYPDAKSMAASQLLPIPISCPERLLNTPNIATHSQPRHRLMRMLDLSDNASSGAEHNPAEANDCHGPTRASTDPATIHLDEDGDLRLQTGSETGYGTRDFVVCSRTMGRSSLVWKKMLFGGFKESRPTAGEWIVSLPDDDPWSLMIVLNIIHGRFAMVPKKPALEELYSILILTNKYDMTRMVRPWANSWLEVAKKATERGENDAMLTSVAWELGDQDLFASRIDSFVVNCSLPSKDRLTTPNGICLEDYDHLGPTTLIGKPNYFC